MATSLLWLALLGSAHGAEGVLDRVASLFRRAGAGIVIVPADPRHGLVAVMPDLAAGAVRLGRAAARVVYHPIWVGTGTVRPHGIDEPLAAA